MIFNKAALAYWKKGGNCWYIINVKNLQKDEHPLTGKFQGVSFAANLDERMGLNLIDCWRYTSDGKQILHFLQERLLTPIARAMPVV